MAEPGRYELHHQDETHLETNPYLGGRVWHRVGEQPALPAAGTNRRVTVFGSVEVFGRGRVEVVCAGQDSACFLERFGCELVPGGGGDDGSGRIPRGR